MPVEINELVIRGVVQGGVAQRQADACADGDDSSGGAGGGQDRDAVVDACVEKVLKILKRSKER